MTSNNITSIEVQKYFWHAKNNVIFLTTNWLMYLCHHFAKAIIDQTFLSSVMGKSMNKMYKSCQNYYYTKNLQLWKMGLLFDQKNCYNSSFTNNFLFRPVRAIRLVVQSTFQIISIFNAFLYFEQHWKKGGKKASSQLLRVLKIKSTNT